MSILLHDTLSYRIPEPRLTQIGELLGRLLEIVDLESHGNVVDVDGFRLRDLKSWQLHVTNTAMNALTPISSVCNSRCHFCFEENVPYARERSLMSLDEARTRLRYFDPETGNALFPSNRNHMESFVHPEALDIIALARQRQPDKVFWITTNGSHFTEETVARLATLKPMIFKLSINSASPKNNRALMGTGDKTETAIAAPGLLKKYGLPYVGGIVAWPTLSFEDMENTCRHLDACDAYAIRIRLPLTHKWLDHQLDVDFHRHWREVADFAHGLRARFETPIIVEPPLFWLEAIIPQIDGVIRNSPAANAGLRAGDLVRAIEERPVRTRVESEAILDELRLAGVRHVSIEIERDGVRHFVLLDDDPATTGFPYSPHGFFRGENYGILHIEDFRLNHIDRLLSTIERHGAKDVLLFSSRLMGEIFVDLVDGIDEFAARLKDVNLHLATIEENTFGGNYNMMDSRVVDDYEAIVARHLEAGRKIDLVLVPKAFGSEWGFDVFGRSLAEITMRYGLPVEQIDWLMVYGRDV